MGILHNEAAGCKISSVAILVGWDGAQWLGSTVSVLWPFWGLVGLMIRHLCWLVLPRQSCTSPKPASIPCAQERLLYSFYGSRKESHRKSLRKWGHPKLIRILQPDKQSHKAG